VSDTNVKDQLAENTAKVAAVADQVREILAVLTAGDQLPHTTRDGGGRTVDTLYLTHDFMWMMAYWSKSDGFPTEEDANKRLRFARRIPSVWHAATGKPTTAFPPQVDRLPDGEKSGVLGWEIDTRAITVSVPAEKLIALRETLR